MSNDNTPHTPSLDDPYIKQAIAEASEIWIESIFPERVEAEHRVHEFSEFALDELARLLLEATDDDRLEDNDRYIAASLALLRMAHIDERFLTRSVP